MLSVFSLLYGGIIRLRNAFYDRGIFRSHGLGAHTISVGNLTAGGTGKTPLVAYIASTLAEQGEKVCVLSRGFGRRNENQRVLVSDGKRVLVDAVESGDEPQELARKLLGKAIVIVDADRIAAAKWAKVEFGITTFVLDDAFQHRKARRDVDIVCIDATDAFGGGKMLPAGRLREAPESLSRAEIAVITRANFVDDISGLKSEILQLAPQIRVFTAIGHIVGIRSIDGTNELERQRPVLAFSALGNPANFYKSLEQFGLNLTATRSYSDHHFYTNQDIEILEAEAKAKGSDALVTTAKDAVKLAGLGLSLECYVAELKLEISDAESFKSFLLK